MSNLNCCCRRDCAGIAVVLSLIVGIITAILRIGGVITVTPVFLWILFGISIVFLAITLIISTVARDNDMRSCRCSAMTLLLTGIIGTILTSLILLAIEFVATSIIGAIITGALLAFFTLTITAAACQSKCETYCSGN